MADHVELLPCPFCGGKAGVANIPNFVGIECGSCGADIGANPKAYPSDTRGADVWIDEATNAWNRRETSKAVVSEEMVERLARFITEECFGYAWDGLGTGGRVTDRGFKPFHYNSFGGKAIQGTQNDMRDVARNAFAALKDV